MNIAKKYLSQLMYINQNINSRQRELDDLRHNIPSASNWNKDKVQGSNKRQDFADKLIKIDLDITMKIDHLVLVRETISKQIDSLENIEYIVLLRERYINQRGFDEIARLMHVSERHIARMHSLALNEFESMFKKEILKHVMKCQ